MPSSTRITISSSSTSRPGWWCIRRPATATGTLVNALLAHCGDSLSGIGGVRRPGIVHRLDKDTSGLMVVAKNDAAHQGLTELFAAHGRDRHLERDYLALVWGALEPAAGNDRRPRSAAIRTTASKMAVVPDGSGRRRPPITGSRKRFGPARAVASLIELPARDRAHPPDSRPSGRISAIRC